MRPAFCDREIHPAGGPGVFILGQVQEQMENFVAEFAGKVQLIYLDPPFGTGEVFQMQLGASKRNSLRLLAYEDNLCQEDYLAMMRNVLCGCYKLLTPTGSLYLHVDYRMSAYLKLMLDDIFGQQNFVNEIIWMYRSGGRSKKHYSRKHDTILFYRKGKDHYFNIEAIGMPRGPERRNHMKRHIDEQGRVCFTIRSGGKTYTYYEDTPIYPSDVWTDIEHLHQRDPERIGYATQKPEALLKRIILASSQPGDLVADFFSGSGTTAAVASKNKRRFLAGDCSAISMYLLRQRLLQQGNAISLLDKPHPLEIRYKGIQNQSIAPCVSVSRQGTKFCCQVNASGQHEAVPVAYCALGKREGTAFHPQDHLFYPSYPFHLSIEACDTPLMQLVFANGEQAFWEL